MNLQETIKSIVAQFGNSILDDPQRLLGLLEDHHAFDQESPESRSAMREMVREGKVRNLLIGNTASTPPELKIDDVDWGALLRQAKVTGHTQVQRQKQSVPKNPYGSLIVQPSIVKVPKVDKWRKLKNQVSRLKKWAGKNRGEIWNSIIIGVILILALLAAVSLISVFCGLILGWANTESWAWTFFWSVIAGLIALGIGEMTVE